MNQDVAELAAELTAIPEYRSRFGALWPAQPIGLEQVSAALAAYVRTLMELGSRYDLNLYRQGTLTPQEDAGLILFEGKARCTTCHTLTPVTRVGSVAYHEPRFKVLGVPADAAGTALDDDPGLGAITLAPGDFGAFRVPELRNLTRTAPYMHNGVFATLEQVVAFYDAGGGSGLGLAVPNRSPEIQPLGLSATERAQLVAFLAALSPDRPNFVERPASVPSGLAVGGS
jgi:cytochrome c peroxidase